MAKMLGRLSGFLWFSVAAFPLLLLARGEPVTNWHLLALMVLCTSAIMVGSVALVLWKVPPLCTAWALGYRDGRQDAGTPPRLRSVD